MLLASKYPQGGIRLSDPHILAPLFSGGGAEYKVEDVEMVTGVRNQAEMYNTMLSQITQGISNIDAKSQSGSATPEDMKNLAKLNQDKAWLVSQLNVLNINTETSKSVAENSFGNLTRVDDQFNVEYINEGDKIGVETWGRHTINELNNIGTDEEGNFLEYKLPSILGKNAIGIKTYINDNIIKLAKGYNKKENSTSNPTTTGEAQESKSNYNYTNRYSALKAAQNTFDDIISDKQFGLKEQLYSYTYEELINSYNSGSKTFGIDKAYFTRFDNDSLTGMTAGSLLYIGKRGKFTDIIESREDEKGQKTYYKYNYKTVYNADGTQSREIATPTQVKINNYEELNIVTEDPSVSVDLSTGFVTDKSYLNQALAIHLGLESFTREKAKQILSKADKNVNLDVLTDEELYARIKNMGQTTAISYANSYGKKLTQDAANAITEIEAKINTSLKPNDNDSDNKTNVTMDDMLNVYQTMFFNKRSEKAYLNHTHEGNAYTQEDKIMFSNVPDMNVLNKHLFPLYYDQLQTLNNNDEARHLAGVGMINLNNNDSNLKVSEHFSNGSGVVVLSAFNGEGGTITLTPSMFNQWGDKQIVQMSKEVFQAAHSDGYGFFLDSDTKKPLTTDLLGSQDRIDSPYKQYKIKLTGKDVLDMKININRYSIGEYLSMSDDKFTIKNNRNLSNLKGTYKELNSLVKNYVTVSDMFNIAFTRSEDELLINTFVTEHSKEIMEMLKKENIEVRYDSAQKKVIYTVPFSEGKPKISEEELNEKIHTYTMQLISEEILAQRSGGITWEDNEEVKNVRMGDVFTNKEIIRIFGYSDKNKRGMHFVDKRAWSGGKADTNRDNYDLLEKDFTDDDFAIITVGVRLNPTDVMPKNTNLTTKESEYYFKRYREMFNPNSASKTGQAGIQTATTGQ